jgi:hypothetical protein
MDRNPIFVDQGSGGRKLFKAEEVPEFKDTDKYWDWRCQFRRFALSQEVSQDSLLTAVNRILQRFTGTNTHPLAQSWNVENIFRDLGDWTLVWKELLRRTDEMYLRKDFLAQQTKQWNALRAEDNPHEFFLHLQTRRWACDEAFTLAGGQPFSDGEVWRHMLRKLPDHIRDECTKLITNFQIGTLTQHRDRIIEIWSTTKAPVKTPKTPTPAARQRVQPTATRTPGNQTVQRKCGLVVSYDTTPAVPEELRGGLYDNPRNTPQQNADNSRRRQLAATRRVCEYCRRPQGEHHASGPNFKMVLAQNTPARTRQIHFDIPEPRVEDITNQLLLPAPGESPV